MKHLLKFVIPAILLLAFDYMAPVVSLAWFGGEKSFSLAASAGLCERAASSGFGKMAEGTPCEWAPTVHYVILGIALLLVALGVRSMLAARKAD